MLLKPCKIILASHVEHAILSLVSEQNNKGMYELASRFYDLNGTLMTNLLNAINLHTCQSNINTWCCLMEMVPLFKEHAVLPSPTQLQKISYSKPEHKPINKCIFYIPILQCVLTSECAVHFHSPDCLHLCIITVFSIPSAAKQNQTNSCSDFKAGKILIVASACLQ